MAYIMVRTSPDTWDVMADFNRDDVILAEDLSKAAAMKLCHFMNGGEEFSWIMIGRIVGAIDD